MMEFAKLTAAELEVLPRDQTVFFFPVGPLEDHGPHLPMGLDLEEAERLCSLAAQHLEQEMPGWRGIVMPKAPLGIDSYTTQVAITVRAHVLRDWLVDACRSLNRLGFLHFACFSGQLGPRQLTAIEDAAWIVCRGKSPLGVPFFLKRRSRPTLISVSSALVKAKDSVRSPFWSDAPEHGGRRDTSVALAILQEGVNLNYQILPTVERQPSFWRGLRERILRQRQSYWGDPSLASSEAGSRYLIGVIDDVFPKMRAVWEGHHPKFLFKSWYSLVPTNKSFFKAWVLVMMIAFLMLAWFSMNYLRFDY